MKNLKLTILLLGTLVFVNCNTSGLQDRAENDGTEPEAEIAAYEESEALWAKDNFDLLAATELLNEANDAAELERLINKKDGINNLDLNGDGYVDYVSVQEFEDRNDGQRGFSLFSRFGPDEIQEIASFVFSRDRPDRRGATLYVRGNDQIYGNNYNYDGNWLDKSLKIADWVFGDRNDYYRSNYDNDRYPDSYKRYRVIDTPFYRERVLKYQVNPAMTKITTTSGKIKIKSPYPGRSYRRAHVRMAKPTKEQIKYYQGNRDKFVKIKNVESRGKDSEKKEPQDGRGRSDDKKDRKLPDPGTDRKPGTVDSKGPRKPPLKSDDSKKGGNLKNDSKPKGKSKSKGKSGKP